MRLNRKCLVIALVVLAALATACADLAAPPAPMTWQAAMVRVQRDMGLRMLARIRAAPQPAASRDRVLRVSK